MELSDRLSIELTVSEWNVVLSILNEQPYKIVATIIQNISAQAQQKTAATVSTQANGSLQADMQ